LNVGIKRGEKKSKKNTAGAERRSQADAQEGTEDLGQNPALPTKPVKSSMQRRN